MSRRLGFEFGVHVFELVRFFFDETPATVTAHIPAIPGQHADVVNTIAFGFADGRAATVVLDRLARGPHRYLELTLDGERATIHTSIGGELRFQAGLHTAARRPFAALRVAKGGTAILQRGDSERVLAREGTNPFAAATARHLAQFIAAITEGTTPAVTARAHRDTLAMALAAYESAESGRRVELRDEAAAPAGVPA
jgi:predicted dehydrogenase